MRREQEDEWVEASRVVSSGAPEGGMAREKPQCRRWCAVPQNGGARKVGASSQCIENDAPKRRTTLKTSRVHS